MFKRMCSLLLTLVLLLGTISPATAFAQDNVPAQSQESIQEEASEETPSQEENVAGEDPADTPEEPGSLQPDYVEDSELSADSEDIDDSDTPADSEVSTDMDDSEIQSDSEDTKNTQIPENSEADFQDQESTGEDQDATDFGESSESSDDDSDALVTSEDIIASGTCGSAISWIIDGDGTLTISGTGEMYWTDSAPWMYGENNRDYTGKYIKKVIIEPGITNIGKSAFESLDISDVSIPATVTHIDSRAFSGCDKLTTVVIPYGVDTIGANAFTSCSILQSVSLPDSLRTIGANAFSYCEKLPAIMLPDSLVTIGEHAFYKCVKLSGIEIPDSVSTIGDYAFRDCNSLSDVQLPAGLECIEDGLFSQCYALEYIDFPENLIDIRPAAFQYCTSLKEVTLPESVVFLGSCAFQYCSALEKIIIPDTVTSLGDCLFEDCTALETASIPQNITVIPQKLFMNCSALKQLHIPRTVTSIGRYAFSNCDQWLNAVIPESTIRINEYAFYNCDQLTDVIIQEGTTTVGMYAFADCTQLTKLSIANSVSCIDTGAFSGCTALASVKLPQNNTKIYNYVFNDCSRLQKIEIPGTVTHIYFSAFGGCDSLSDVYYGGTEDEWIALTSNIDSSNEPLLNAENKHFDLFATHGTFGDNLTWTVDQDRKLTISGTGPMPDYYSGDAPWNGVRDKITYISIGKGVTSIGANAFWNCSNVQTVHIYYTVKSIGKNAFATCNQINQLYYSGAQLHQWSNLCSNTQDGNNNLLYVKNKVFDWYPDGDISGECGDNVMWAFDELNGTLVISGTGAVIFSPWSSYKNQIKEVIIEEGITSLYDMAFYGYTNIEKLTLPASLTEFEISGPYWAQLRYDPPFSAFYGCTKITSAGPAGSDCDMEFAWTTEIPEGALLGLHNLKKLIVPGTVSKMPDNHAHWNVSFTEYGDDFGGFDNITSIGPIGTGCDYEYGWETTIPEQAFAYCVNLEKVSLPVEITAIEKNAFKGCAVPTDVYYAGSQADWNALIPNIEEGNDALLNATNIHFGEEMVIEIKEYPFKYAGHLTGGYDANAVCYYSDGYFLNDAREYDSHLATMSLCFELSTWSRTDKPFMAVPENPKSADAAWQNAYNLLTDLGYQSFYVSDDWEKEPTKDSIGAVYASKRNIYDGSTIVAVGIRGGGYGQEWASNFTVGKNGEHDGFRIAKEEVLRHLNKYIVDNGITGEITLWLVGYSRGGCVANMVAGDLLSTECDVEQWVSIASEDMFVYTFEAPQGALEEETYNYRNIHNIAIPNDLVPLVAPASWGFGRYNTVRWLPTAETSDTFSFDKHQMLYYYRGLDGDDAYNIREWAPFYYLEIDWSLLNWRGVPFVDVHVKKSPTDIDTGIPTRVILQESTDFLFDYVIGDRETYYYDFQAGVREILAFLYGQDIAVLLGDGARMSWTEFWNKFKTELTPERLMEILEPMYAVSTDGFEERKDAVRANLLDVVRDILGDSDLWSVSLCVANFPDTLSDVLWRIIEGCLEDLYNKNTDSVQNLFYLIDMLGGVGQAHFCEVPLAWLMYQDSYYYYGAKDMSYPNYRLICINCPVDVHVYRETNGELVASIVNDVPQAISGSSIKTYIGLDGEKVVILPSDGSYRVSMTATGEGSVNYAVREYDLNSGCNTRLVNYFDIPVSRGDSLTASIPALSESQRQESIPNGSDTNYTLSSQGVNLTPDSDIRGSGANASRYEVKVTSSSESGFVSGGGRYAYGEFAKVTASGMSGVDFIGWYQDGVLVSTEPEYRFSVKGDTNIIASFEETETYLLTVVAEGNGVVRNGQYRITEGTKVALEAVAGIDADFIEWSADAGSIEDSTSQKTVYTMPAADITVTARFTADTDLLPVKFTQADETNTILPGRVVEIDGDSIVIGDDGNFAAHRSSQIMVTFEYNTVDSDIHKVYPVGMYVWKLEGVNEDGIGGADALLAIRVPELDNILQYSGSSIRITGNKGIRMITSITQENKKALTSSSGLGGYKLLEYGTALCFARELEGDKSLILGQEYTRSNYAYKKGVADPVFAYSGNLMQYTNVLVGFTNDQCKEDIAMRPYMILEDAEGEQVTVYGGTVYRSIGYIAWQNRLVFSPGTGAYNFVWDIIHQVYGDKYDADYRK